MDQAGRPTLAVPGLHCTYPVEPPQVYRTTRARSRSGGFAPQALSLYPVLKIHQTAARQSARNANVMPALTTTFTSEMP
jgi:hypothetical protein